MIGFFDHFKIPFDSGGQICILERIYKLRIQIEPLPAFSFLQLLSAEMSQPGNRLNAI